jgi:RNA polymerase sigma factor (TIGR02999 family)
VGEPASPNQPGEVTVLLREWTEGQPGALDRLFEMVYPHLRHIAGALFRGERTESMLQPTSVVNELFLKLVRHRRLQFDDREHFLSLSARLMRRLLIDQAREQGRRKRDGGAAIPLAENLAWVGARDVEWMDLDKVLDALGELDARKLKMVELRFFLGFTADETADLLHTSKATVDRELKFVRGWMSERLRQGGSPKAS